MEVIKEVDKKYIELLLSILLFNRCLNMKKVTLLTKSEELHNGK